MGFFYRPSQAYRCLYVAFSYAQAKRWQESAALYERALTYADAAVKGWNNIPDSDEKKKALVQMEELKQQVCVRRERSVICSYLSLFSLPTF